MGYIYFFPVFSFLHASCAMKSNEISLAGGWDFLMDSTNNPETTDISLTKELMT